MYKDNREKEEYRSRYPWIITTDTPDAWDHYNKYGQYEGRNWNGNGCFSV
jgi:hypothetical protein